MSDPTSASLFDQEINKCHLIIKKLEKKLENKRSEMFVVSNCVIFYEIKENKIKEITNILKLNPLSKEKAEELKLKLNNLENVIIRTYKEVLKEYIKKEKATIARLNKSF